MDLDQIKQQIAGTTTFDELEKIRIELLGRQGTINQEFQKIKNLSIDEKKSQGQKINENKIFIETAIMKQSKKVTKENKKYINNKTVFSLKKLGHLHPITITERQVNEIFRKFGFSLYDGPEIETDEYCFQRMNVPLPGNARQYLHSGTRISPSHPNLKY